MECKANGVVDSRNDESALANLQERLARISGEPLVPLSQLEIVLLGPSYTPGIKGGELRVLRQLEEPSAAKGARSSPTWKVRHEGMPLRGKGLADLPATVRAVNESSCVGADVLGFWTALGFQQRFSMIKQGFCVDCHLDGQDVHVTVVKVCKEGSSGAAGQQVVPGFWLVEATTRAAEGQHVAAAAAIGTLAGLLEPLVVLQKQ